MRSSVLSSEDKGHSVEDNNVHILDREDRRTERSHLRSIHPSVESQTPPASSFHAAFASPKLQFSCRLHEVFLRQVKHVMYVEA